MKYQANRSYVSNDVVMTPKPLAKALVEHFQPQGKGLEPCAGCGNVLEFLPNAEWCEIEKERDFYDYKGRVDYIFTNPPWSQIRKFLAHSMEVAGEVLPYYNQSFMDESATERHRKRRFPNY